MLEVPSTRCVLSANFGSKKLLDATIWGADAGKNFATDVVAFIELASVNNAIVAEDLKKIVNAMTMIIMEGINRELF